MKPTTRHPRAGKDLARRIVAGATLVSFLVTPPYAMASLTEISNAPLASASTAQIPPNVMFVLDASGSMNSEYMPDSISGRYDSERVGSVSNRCNTIYYNPNVTYLPAKNADGTNFPDASFTSAVRDPFSSNSPSGSDNLSSNFSPWGGWSSQTAFYFVYETRRAEKTPVVGTAQVMTAGRPPRATGRKWRFRRPSSRTSRTGTPTIARGSS